MRRGLAAFTAREQKKFMSTKSSSPKILFFDAVFFTYTAALLCYVAFLFVSSIGLVSGDYDKDFAIRYMSTFSLICLGVFLFMLAALKILSSTTSVSTVGAFLFSNPIRKLELAQTSFLKSFWGLHLLVTLILTFFVSLRVTQFSIYELTDPDGLGGAIRLFSDLANPNFDLLPTAIIEVFETIFIAFLGTAVAIPIAFLLSFVCAKNIMTNPVAFAIYVTLRTLLNVMRSVEPLIWAIIFTVWVGVGPFAGMLALLIHSIASLTKQYSEIVEGVSDGPIEGIRSTGASTVQTVWFAIVPQVVLPYIAFTIYRWDINVRMATVIGLVGGGGIGTLLIKYQGQAMWREVGCIILVIAIVVWVMDTASAYIREALK